MPKITLAKAWIEAAKERAILNSEESDAVDAQSRGQGNITLNIESLPVAFIVSLLEDNRLKSNHRVLLAFQIHGLRQDDAVVENVYKLKVTSPVAFGSTFVALGRTRANAELYWNGRWYPAIVLIDFREDENKLARNVFARVVLGMSGQTHEVLHPIDPGLFLDEAGEPCALTTLHVLEKIGFRGLQTAPADFNVRLVNAERLTTQHGTQLWVKGAVLEFKRKYVYDAGLSELPLGTPDMPRRAVVEPSLEVRDSEYGSDYWSYRSTFGESVTRVPLIRVFSLDTKSFVYADIDDVAPYDYDPEALAKLYLPGEMKGILQKVFETPTEQLFGDLIRGKHGGVVILACGNPGVGKTLTAEVYAEMTERPLYVLEFGELGTTVSAIEENLSRIFARVVRWRAVLQFDECEIFLSHRNDDLERSAIVGIFLRMLDYYEGLLFLTTNRPDALDYAIRSRVMLRLEYPDLDARARAAIWSTMFTAAGLELTDGRFEDLGESTINGRQIRNLVRLARILYPDRKITRTQVIALMQYGCR